MPVPYTTLALVPLAAYGLRWATAWRREREVASRLPVGPDGMIAGAGPFTLPADGEERGAALLLHGFADTPQALREMAAALAAGGWAVRVPLLPGHGRTLREFAQSRADDWSAAVHAALEETAANHEAVHVVGLSMGGALAAAAVAGRHDVRSLTLLAPYLDMPRPIRRLADWHRLLSLAVPYATGDGERSINDEEAAKRTLGYGVLTPRLLHELSLVARRGWDALPRITAPTLIVQSREDNRIHSHTAESALKHLGTADKRLEWLTGCGHVITVDHGRERVFALTQEWMAGHQGAVMGARGRGPR